MPEPTDPTEAAEVAAAGWSAGVRRVVAEAARSTRRRPGCWVPGTLPRVALAEAAGLLPSRPQTLCLPTTEPTDLDRPAARGTADEHDHDQ